jgi:predicted dehydrogenase
MLSGTRGPHIFDIQNYLMDEWPVEVSCTGGAFRRQRGEESAYIISRFKSGTMSMAAISWLVPRKRRLIFITGEERSAQVDAVSQTISILEHGDVKQIPLQPNNTIRDELMHFIESILDPGREPVNNAAIGVRTVELIEAAKSSMAKGGLVKLDRAEATARSAGA